jgi:CHAT domain-containing protein
VHAQALRLFARLNISGRHLRPAALACGLALVALTVGCADSYRMGDPIVAKPAAKPQAPAVPAPATASAAPTAQAAAPIAQEKPKAKANFDKWNEKWRQIQNPPDHVDWVEHFRVCAIMYRYRNYDALFRCLDLFEAKVARGGAVHVQSASRHADAWQAAHFEAVRATTPVMTGWMRANAYAELGEPEAALKWAESAWNALPEDYRQTKQSFFGGQVQNDFSGVAGLIAGSSDWVDDEARLGRDNPAGLDMSGPTIAMSLCAERSLLYQHLGEPQKAKTALDELRKWEELRKKDGMTGLIPTSAPYKTKAELLSIGPLFAMGEYAQVVDRYNQSSAAVEHKRHMEQLRDSLARLWLPGVVMEGLTDLAFAPFTPSDARLFTVALEDASNALIYAESLMRLGKINEARAMLDTLLALPELRAMGNLYWVALYERSLIALGDGKRDEAIRLLQQSVEAIESVRSTISFEAAKIGFAGDKQTVYAALVAALAQAGDWNGAFLVAERAKARALVDLLAQRRDLAPPPGVDAKVRELFASAATVDGGTGIATDESAARGIKLVEDSRAELGAAAPEAASLVSVQSVSVAAIGARMSADETLIDYYRAGDDLYALVLNGTRVVGFKLSAKGLDEEVRAYRQAIERRDPKAAERGRPLYDRLMRPLAGEIRSNKLTISPHGVLHYLPFSALLDGDEYLLDRYSLRLIPSAGALVYLKTDRPAKTGTLLALGNPDLGNARYDLPNAQIEAVNVAALFPSSRALVRGAASKSAIEELGNGFSILHFATHGKFNTDDPLRSGLYLAKGNDGDGVLTVSDLYTLRWDVDLVTLSACETALGKVANGDDVIGLTRGFLYAGARSIVASLWEVDDAATEQLMVSFYRNQQNHDKREALRLAQIETRKKYPQPAFWAAFQIVGRAD